MNTEQFLAHNLEIKETLYPTKELACPSLCAQASCLVSILLWVGVRPGACQQVGQQGVPWMPLREPVLSKRETRAWKTVQVMARD